MFACPARPDRRYEYHARVSRYCEIDGRRLFFVDVGAGQPVVFLHAFPLSSAMWQPQLDALPGGWRAIAPDLRGFGGSRLPDNSPGTPATSFDDHADDLERLWQHLDLPPAVVVGLSMGGYLAFAFYRRRPDLVAALVLADSRAEPDTEDARARRDEMKATALNQGAAAVAEAMVPKLIGASTESARPGVARDVHAMIRQSAPDAIAAALECLKTRADSTPMLGEIACPTLVLVGDEDELTPPPLSERMVRAIRGASLAILPGAGHLSNLEQPEAFNDELFGFLTRVHERRRGRAEHE